MSEDVEHLSNLDLEVASPAADRALALALKVMNDLLVRKGFLQAGEVASEMRCYPFTDEVALGAVRDMAALLEETPETEAPILRLVVANDDGGVSF